MSEVEWVGIKCVRCGAEFSADTLGCICPRCTERHPIPAWRPAFNSYVAELRARMEKGAATYGDASFSKPLATTLAEIRAELLDISGWSIIATARIDALIARAAEIERESEGVGAP